MNEFYAMKRSTLQYVLGLLLVNLLTFIAFAVVHVYTLNFFRHSQAEDLVKSIRNDLLMGDRARAFSQLGARRGSNQTFVAIELFETEAKKPILIGDRYGDSFRQENVSNVFMYDKITVALDFGGRSEDSPGYLTFYFSRFANAMVSFYAWLALTVAIAIWAIRSLRLTARIMDERLAARRHETIAQMAQMLSHDLRAPLNTVERVLQLLPNSSLHGESKGLRYSLNQIYGMIESIRYMDSESRRKRVQFLLSFEKGISGLVAKAESKNVVLRYPRDLALVVYADESKFERIWLNLVSNAIDAAKSTVEISVDSHGRDLVLRVLDDGSGVPSEIQAKLFQRGSTHGKRDGTGLGLAYVRQALLEHGGDVKYIRQGTATLFECLIPGAIVSGGITDNVESTLLIEAKETNADKKVVVSVCFSPQVLNEQVLNRLISVSGATNYVFISELQSTTTILISNIDSILDEAFDTGKRIIRFNSSMSDEEIIKRAPTRLGLKG